MQVRIILENAHQGGTFFLGSGREKPDGYRYDSVPGKEHLCSLTMSAAEFAKAAPDFLAHYGMPDTPVHVELIPEAGDADIASQQTIDELHAKLASQHSALKEANDEIARLRNALVEAGTARESATTESARITDEQLMMLGERDRILEVLMPLAGEMDTPIDVLTRIMHEHRAAQAGPSQIPQPPVETPKAPDENTRRAELEKLGKRKIAALAAGIPGIEAITEKADLIEAILIHESERPAQAAA